MGQHFEPTPRRQSFTPSYVKGGEIPADGRPLANVGQIVEAGERAARRRREPHDLVKMIADAPRDHRITQVEAALVDAAIQAINERKASVNG